MSNAEAIKTAAKHLASQGKAIMTSTEPRVWMCDIIDALASQNPMSRDEIRKLIAAEHRNVIFGTADLIGAYDAKKLAASRTRVQGYREDVVFVYAIG